MYKMKIPQAVCPSYEEMQSYCNHHNCELNRGGRYNYEWEIESEDLTNFFWLGVNINNDTLNRLKEL